LTQINDPAGALLQSAGQAVAQLDQSAEVLNSEGHEFSDHRRGLHGNCLPESFAQDEPIEAPLTAATSNPAGCTALDPALSRVVTKMGDPATIKRNAVAP
jgi:hypothetical protein